MTKAAIREPKTPEEKEAFKKSKEILQADLMISFIFYLLIFLIVPKAPDNSFYLGLDALLNTYLFGDIMPEYSSNFYFTMKVAWCLSLLYTLLRFFILLLACHFYITPKGVSVNLYLSNYDTLTTKHRVVAFVLMILTVLACFYFSISLYAFGVYNDALTVGRGLEAIFYGNFFLAMPLFLFLHAILIFLGMHVFTFHFYHAFFCKGELRL